MIAQFLQKTAGVSEANMLDILLCDVHRGGGGSPYKPCCLKFKFAI